MTFIETVILALVIGVGLFFYGLLLLMTFIAAILRKRVIPATNVIPAQVGIHRLPFTRE